MFCAMTEIDHLLRVLAAFCEATGRAESTVSTQFLGAGSRVRQLREGADMGVQRAARALEDFSAAWPEGAAWPDGVPRPTPREQD